MDKYNFQVFCSRNYGTSGGPSAHTATTKPRLLTSYFSFVMANVYNFAVRGMRRKYAYCIISTKIIKMGLNLFNKINVRPRAAGNNTSYAKDFKICNFLTVPDNIANNFTS